MGISTCVAREQRERERESERESKSSMDLLADSYLNLCCQGAEREREREGGKKEENLALVCRGKLGGDVTPGLMEKRKGRKRKRSTGRKVKGTEEAKTREMRERERE